MSSSTNLAERGAIRHPKSQIESAAFQENVQCHRGVRTAKGMAKAQAHRHKQMLENLRSPAATDDSLKLRIRREAIDRSGWKHVESLQAAPWPAAKG